MICLTISVGALRLQTLISHSLPNILRQWMNILNQTLVDPHLEAIPGLRALATRGLTSGDLEDLGWEADGSLNAKI